VTGWRAYLGDDYGGNVAIYAAPARATNLERLPPSFVMVGGLYGFVDEDVDYAKRLNRAGVPTELHLYPGCTHGFDGLAGPAVVRRARNDMNDWLARTLQG
jgi:acetyl esterase/lipase